MLERLFPKTATNSIPILYMRDKDSLLDIKLSDSEQNWLKAHHFKPSAGGIHLLPDASGNISKVLFCHKKSDLLEEFGGLVEKLPIGVYHLDASWPQETHKWVMLAWALGAYHFDRYKPASHQGFPQLFIPEHEDLKHVHIEAEATYLVRDLINTPCEDLGPEDLFHATEKVGKPFKAQVTQIVGDDLLTENFPMIHAVGRAGSQEPRLIELTWGHKTDKNITLVGKGVCFDTGGLRIKPISSMALMKKDMGGAAHVLGLAHMIMSHQLPVNLRVLIPAVENNISSNAYRPGDVLTSRNGKTVEVLDTDAEGRLVLADALTYACEQDTELLIDFATLTGAARVALGSEVPVIFASEENTLPSLQALSMKERDPLWGLPLWKPYRKQLDSKIAHLANTGSSPYGGAITAALFLQEFVKTKAPWMHLDLMAWNAIKSPGKPAGGEAMGMRTIFHWIQEQL